MQHLYLSYPENDYGLAHRLVDDLQAAGYPVFVDAVSSVGTMSWAAETRHAIRTCGALLMVLSPAEGRRVGIRHEGVLAKRRHKPVYVLRRSPGEVPRYLQDAVIIDCASDRYDSALAQLLAVLPPVERLRSANVALPRRSHRPRRPPRHPVLARRRRRFVMGLVLLLIALAACLTLGIAFGLIPV